MLLLLGSPLVFQCVYFLECSPHWAALRPVHTTMAGVSGLRSPHCLVLPCMEFSQLPAKNMPGESAAERHRWVMLHTWLHGPAPQLPVVCGLASRPPGTPGAFLHCSSSCGKRGWEALGFGIEHRVCALLCCVRGQNCVHASVWGVQPAQQFFPFGSKFPALSRSWAFGHGSRDP